MDKPMRNEEVIKVRKEKDLGVVKQDNVSLKNKHDHAQCIYSLVSGYVR